MAKKLLLFSTLSSDSNFLCDLGEDSFSRVYADNLHLDLQSRNVLWAATLQSCVQVNGKLGS